MSKERDNALLSDIDAALSASAEPNSCGACSNGCINGCQLEKDSPEYPRIHVVHAHKHTCANVQPGSTPADICDCGAIAGRVPVPAESSAPVEIDERAEFKRRFPDYDHTLCSHEDWKDQYDDPKLGDMWNGWQARAALERKP